jgi:hypothetical protein
VSQAPDHLGPTLQAKAKVTGGSSIGSFFGFPAHRVLTVTVTNIGHTPIQAPVISAGWGTPGGVEHVIAAPRLPPLPAGQTTVIKLPFQLDALAHGSYAVSGRYSGAPIPASFRATTSASPPWGLLVAALVVLQVLLLGVRNIVRRRLRRRDAAQRAVARALVLPVATAPSSTRVAVVPGPVITMGGPNDGAEPAAADDDGLPAGFVPPPPPPRVSGGPAAAVDEPIEPTTVESGQSIHWLAPEAAASSAS